MINVVESSLVATVDSPFVASLLEPVSNYHLLSDKNWIQDIFVSTSSTAFLNFRYTSSLSKFKFEDREDYAT